MRKFALALLVVLVAAGAALATNMPVPATPPGEDAEDGPYVNLTTEEVRKLAEGGDAEAQTELGGRYATGQDVAPNEARAMEWYLKAANQGNAEAQWAIGNMLLEGYDTGKGMKRDGKEAVVWLQKGADGGNWNAQYVLGELYEQGKYVKKDVNKAIELWKKAARSGDQNAVEKLAAHGVELN